MCTFAGVDAIRPDRLGSPSPTRLESKLTAPLLNLGLCFLVIQQPFPLLAPNHHCLSHQSFIRKLIVIIICVADLTDNQQSLDLLGRELDTLASF